MCACVHVCMCERRRRTEPERALYSAQAWLFFSLFLPYLIAHAVNAQSLEHTYFHLVQGPFNLCQRHFHLHGCHQNVTLENCDIWRMSSHCYLIFIISLLMSAREPGGHHHFVNNTLFLDSWAASTFPVLTAGQRAGDDICKVSLLPALKERQARVMALGSANVLTEPNSTPKELSH